jgi:hypothetical protein
MTVLDKTAPRHPRAGHASVVNQRADYSQAIPEPRRRRIRAARARFCEFRRHPDHTVRWLAWLDLRAEIEDWPHRATSAHHVRTLLLLADAWKRGHRPPTSLHEAMAQGLAAIGRRPGPEA